MDFREHLFGALGRIARDVLRSAARPQRRTPRQPPTVRERRAPSLSDRYPGDYRGLPRVTYDPHPGALPDPGEVVWTWVPYEEDHGQGKDRPVLLVGRDGDWLLALPLTSEDHDADAAQEAADGRYWMDIGKGSWDAQGRASEVRLNRVVRVDPRGVRRVTGRVPRATFERVAVGMREHLG